MKRKEIIEILTKYQTTNPEYVREMHNSMVIDPMDYHKIAEAILQALEEEPFLGCDVCDSSYMDGIIRMCNNPDSYHDDSSVSTTTSCIHHSGRKELTEQEKLFAQITEQDIEEFIEYIKKRKEKK